MTTNDDPYSVLDQAAARQTLAAEAARALAGARAKLILGRDATSAFFACLVLRLRLEVDWDCPTLKTDGRVLAYNPAFVASLSPAERIGVLAHEVLHCALAHPGRRGVRDRQTWNVACDLAVNPILAKAKFTLPASRLMPGEGEYEFLEPGKSADEYYAWLDLGPQPDGASDGPNDLGGCGEVIDPDRGSPAAAAATAADWRVALVAAQTDAEGRGELPVGLARTVDAVLRPPADWRAVLREFVASAARNDYSWARPNRRYIAQGLYLPGLYSDDLGDVVLALDTSGSVGERELGLFLAEADAILGAYACTLTVLAHDTRVHTVRTWQSTDGPLALDLVGGGGTSHACVFEWIDASGLDPACVVCLTDLETRFPDNPPTVPVLWAVVGDNTDLPPFGRRVAVGG